MYIHLTYTYHMFTILYDILPDVKARTPGGDPAPARGN